MSITVGTDTYATLEEATAYITNNYVSSAEKRTAWEALAISDQEIHMRNATKRIDRCRFIGIRAEADQTLEFPRYILREGCRIYYDFDITTQTETVPDAVKYAQIEEALELATPGDDTDENQLLNGPVSAYTIGHLSETYGAKAARSTAAYNLYSKRAAQLLEPYTNGSFRIT
jgi:hypothetical protein